MSTHISPSNQLPTPLICSVLAICVAPFLLNLFGVDFGIAKVAFPFSPAQDMTSQEHVDGMFRMLAGNFTHTILEWTAFCTAIFTVVLAFLHFKMKHDVTTLIIGVALLCAGTMDAFHTLAADRLIESVADNRNFIPFTWAISRMFNGLIMAVGIALVFRTKHTPVQGNLRFVLIISVLFGVVAFVIIEYCANTAQLPQTMYPNALITRPYDVLPLMIFMVSGVTLYRWFHQQRPGFFSHALLVSLLPQIAVQLHMAFGSTALFDNHFNIAHFLKIFAYLVPFGGLALEYLHTSAGLAREVHERALAERRLAVQHGVTKVLAENSTLEEATPKILQDVSAGLGWQLGAWWKVDDQAGILRCTELWNADPTKFEEFSKRTREITFAPGMGLPGRVWQTGHAAWIKDVINDQKFPRATVAHKVGLHGAFALPITFQGQIFGVLEFFSTSIQEPDEQLLTELNVLGRQIGLLAERRRIEISQKEIAAEFECQMMAIDKTQAVIEFMLDGTVLTANENFLQMMGYGPEEILGKHHRMFCEPGIVESQEYQNFWAKLNRGEFDAGIYRRVGKGGETVWVQATYNPIVDSRGQPYKVLKLATDITSQKMLEEALKTREGELVDAMILTKGILDTAADGIITIDEEGRIESFNKAARGLFGYSECDVLGLNVSMLMPTPYREEHDGYLERYRQTNEKRITGTDREVVGQRKDGTIFPMTLGVSEVRMGARRVFTGIVRDITESKQAEAALRQNQDHLQTLVEERTRDLSLAKETAERANRAKSEFLANMSHELRTPMHAILSFAGMASSKLETAPTEKLLHYLTRISDSGTRLLTLLNDLLDLSKLEAGKMTLAIKEEDLYRLTSKIAGEVEELVTKKGVRLERPEPLGPTRVSCDAAKIGQVVLNLLSNAIKFTPEGKTITVTLHPATLAGGRRETDVAEVPALCLTVQDEGVGIPADELEAVFDKFVQSSKTNTGAGGTGLGLAICKEIMEAHRGRIWAEARPDGGAAFICLLPLQQPHYAHPGKEQTHEPRPVVLTTGG